ncbi:MAG: TetR/AcrR family transcriptional regulator [Solirubrobacteraceae bacterium]
MGPIRREQICRAAAAVIAREGFSGTTMRLVADEAQVSTGMLNHYFANREDLLTQALVFVSERNQQRMRAAIEALPPGPRRLATLLDSALAEEVEASETWRVWINAYGAAVRLPSLRRTIEDRLHSWYEVIDLALEGVVPPEPRGSIPWSWLLDAMLNGLAIQALTSEAALDRTQIRDEIIRTLFGKQATAGRGRTVGATRAGASRNGAGATPPASGKRAASTKDAATTRQAAGKRAGAAPARRAGAGGKRAGS